MAAALAKGKGMLWLVLGEKKSRKMGVATWFERDGFRVSLFLFFYSQNWPLTLCESVPPRVPFFSSLFIERKNVFFFSNA